MLKTGRTFCGFGYLTERHGLLFHALHHHIDLSLYAENKRKEIKKKTQRSAMFQGIPYVLNPFKLRKEEESEGNVHI